MSSKKEERLLVPLGLGLTRSRGSRVGLGLLTAKGLTERQRAKVDLALCTSGVTTGGGGGGGGGGCGGRDDGHSRGERHAGRDGDARGEGDGDGGSRAEGNGEDGDDVGDLHGCGWGFGDW